MHTEDDKNLSGLESKLAALAPPPSRLDRDQLMFQAGRQQIHGGRLWPAVSAFLGAATLALLVMVLHRPTPEMMERVVYVSPAPKAAALPRPKPAPDPVQPSLAASVEMADDLPFRNPRLELEDQLLRWGLDALPDVACNEPSKPLTLDSLLGTPTKGTQRPTLFPLGSWFRGGDRS